LPFLNGQTCGTDRLGLNGQTCGADRLV